MSLISLMLLHLSWDSITECTVSGCFKCCGFIPPESEDQDSSVNESDSMDRDEARFLLSRVNSGVSFDDHMNVDEQVLTS